MEKEVAIDFEKAELSIKITGKAAEFRDKPISEIMQEGLRDYLNPVS